MMKNKFGRSATPFNLASLSKITRFLCVFLLVSIIYNVSYSGRLYAETPEKLVENRQEIMKSYGKSMRIIAAMMRGKIEYDAQKLSQAANVIVENSGAVSSDLYQKGSIVGDSEASPAIWQDWDRFTDLMEQVGFYAFTLAHSTKNDRIDGAVEDEILMLDQDKMRDEAYMTSQSPDVNFKLMANSCSTCHKSFRIKKE